MLKRIPPKRRRLGLTDYRKRLKLVKSALPRLVIRRTNRYLITQVIKSKLGGDETLITVTSKKLADYGWRAGFKNTPAAYLTGFLAGLLAKKKGIGKAVVDIGLHRAVKGSKVFAAVKGFIDAGVEVAASEGVFPDEDRIKGVPIMEYYKSIKESDVETIQFSKSDEEVYMNLDSHFSQVKERILKEVGGS
ncbi:MAG: 50S ribosomal protein L18 [Candidatus Wolframiiraptor sp.]|nr:MAG: 50S ribosomal protein L18 [Candidatus Wolframiiraptor sp.]